MLNTLLAPLRTEAAHRGLTVLAEAIWPESDEDTLPMVAGFISSSFSPLAAEVGERCLRRGYGERPLPPEQGERVAVVLMSPLGDLAAARHVARTVAAGERVGPLLFFESVPHAVGGHLAARWGLAGPMVSLSSATAGLDVAALLFGDGDADYALVLLIEQDPDGADRAAAVLVTRVSPVTAEAPPTAEAAA